MDKIIDVIKKMLLNSEKISKVINNNSGEYFFLYDEKFVRGIKKDDKEGATNYFLYFYPDIKLPIHLVNVDDFNREAVNFITFQSSDYFTDETEFENLYNVVYNKQYGFDKVVNEILSI